MMDELTKIVIGVSGTVLGGFLGYFIRLFIEHKLAIDRIRENIKITDYNKACSKLRGAFSPTLSFIYIAIKHGSHDRPDIDKHIKDALLTHGAAVEEFRPFIHKSGREDYQKAWEDYRKTVAIDQYELSAEARTENITVEELLERKIHNILKYAEIK